MVSFTSDYVAGAHPFLLQRLAETNLDNLPGYGTDPYCASAKEKIKKAFGCPDADVRFLVGGTQTNQNVIDSMLRPYEGVLSATTGHVNAHEAGAIEFTGHKVIPLPAQNGKITAEAVDAYLETYLADESFEHIVAPGMVYISFPTEYGTLYSKAELSALAEVCRRRDLILYADGARLGYGLCSLENDVSPADLAELCDVFYVGGTKVGALCGEAVVFTKNNTPKRFLSQIKQHGALLAKGWVLGVQFDALFTDDLYFEIGRHAIRKAEEVKNLFRKKGIPFFLDSPTNQQFVVLENQAAGRLREKIAFSFWEKFDETHTVYRFATSWSTTDRDIAALEAALEEYR